MMATGPAALPAPALPCRITVVIPARDEASSIVGTLAALCAQRDVGGRELPSDLFDVIVFANNCSDDTAAAVRSIAARTPAPRIWVIEDTLPNEDAHIGTARKFVMDVAAARFYAAGKPDGIIASIDSDTLADRRWIAAIVHEMPGRDAVAGHVTIAQPELERLFAPVRLLYARELTYRRVLAEVESLIDPVPENPQPQHSSFVGASFGVTARCYRAAGGLPPVRRLEDFAFSHALRRIDARVRYSPLMRATTSARLTARVDGGFGTFMAQLHACARRGTSFTVEHPLRTLEDLESRSALRRIWRGVDDPGDIEQVAEIFNLPPAEWLRSIDPAIRFGRLYEGLAQRAESGRRRYAQKPVEFAIATLRAAAADAVSRRLATDDDVLGTLGAG